MLAFPSTTDNYFLSFLFKVFFYVYMSMHVYDTSMQVLAEAEEGVRFLQLELQAVVGWPTWMLGTGNGTPVLWSSKQF